MGGVPSYLKLTGQLALNQPQGKLRKVKKKKTEKSHEKGKGSFSRDHANQTAKGSSCGLHEVGGPPTIQVLLWMGSGMALLHLIPQSGVAWVL